MGYERNDRRPGFSGDRNYGDADRGRYYGTQGGYGQGRDDDRARSYGDYGNYGGSGSRDYRGEWFNYRGDDDRRPRGDDDRGFFDRAGDEVRSWFGDDDAERRRRQDEARAGYEDRGQGDWAAGSRSRHEHDPHYRTWRDRQLQSLDTDYDEYRRENQGRFDSEFGSWRQNRQGQRDLLTRVQEHQEVVGSDGAHIGTVDHVRGDRIMLTKSDQAAGGRHHSIPCSWIIAVEDKITVSKTADQAKGHWRDERRNEEGGLFGRNDESAASSNRSFSGTK